MYLASFVGLCFHQFIVERCQRCANLKCTETYTKRDTSQSVWRVFVCVLSLKESKCEIRRFKHVSVQFHI